MFLERLNVIENMCFDVDPWETGRMRSSFSAETKAKAALVTGPRKIFNDVAEVVESLSKDVESLQRCGQDIHGGNGAYGTDAIRGDVSLREQLMKELPEREAAFCAEIITKTRITRTSNVRSSQNSGYWIPRRAGSPIASEKSKAA
jgi:hypothetical protein